MLPKLCHLDNDLEIIIIIQYIYCVVLVVVHMTYILTWGHFFSHGTPVWSWPVHYTWHVPTPENFGDVDQLVDRPLSMREVPGSKPGISRDGM